MTSQPASNPAHTNRLVRSTSPYLLQHAHNPVDWFPWGPEALAKARTENKPIFLSIGYSACHWCHVMERESFENDAIARILNEHFVSIKVDREERPDLDEIYMSATLIYNQGSGGWPMSVFLRPDQKPFFAGTYFPPDSRYGRRGFGDLLQLIAQLWREDRDKVNQAAEALSEAVQRFSQPQAAEDAITAELVSRIATALANAFDRSTGGLASGQSTNKFPPSMAMSLMLRQYHRTLKNGQPDSFLLEMVSITLDHMADGGIYDHLGGGIARYSTDLHWLVPHFEKMLYDQALVSGIYLEAYQLTRNGRYAAVARDIFRYVLADLQSPDGGFCSARDADSEGVEGKYYVWSKQEVMEVLGDKVGPLFCSYYDVTDGGNWEGTNILNVERDLETVARLHDVELADLQKLLAEARERLLAVRARRVPPHLDDKVLTSWNGLMIASLARGARILDEPKYAQAAARAADFILTRMSEGGRLLRTSRGGAAHTKGYLDDYAFFVEGLLDLYEATFDQRWLDEAVRLNDDMIRHFRDESDGSFYFSADDAEQLIVRTKDVRDGAIPAGNSVALMNLLRLSHILGRDDLLQHSERLMRAVAGSIQSGGSERLMAAVDFYHSQPREIVVMGSPADTATGVLLRVLEEAYDPYRVLLLSDPQAPESARRTAAIPLLQGKTLVQGKPAVYICRNRACRPPVTNPEELRRELAAN